MSLRPKQLNDSEEFYGIKILKDGTWLYRGSPIARINMVRLFASVLKRDAAGDYWLITPAERGRIEVEDAPFTAIEVLREGSVLKFRTNLDAWVEAGPQHPIRVSADGAPYILVRSGLEAKISRAVYYELVEMATPDGKNKNTLGVTSNGVFFPIGQL